MATTTCHDCKRKSKDLHAVLKPFPRVVCASCRDKSKKAEG